MNQIKPIAFFLPQFHPVPENDEWWGEGFTEWNNVVTAKPRFKGHYQPHLPRHLGFYDLRLADTREAQAELAERYGIYGFCYYHYWFNGRRILERPVDAILEAGKPDFPFMLCWANENWSRNWDGEYDRVLLEQHYSVQDFKQHARHLLRYFRDPRYIRVDGRPVFAIYKDAVIDCLADGIDAFREELHSNGTEVYLCRIERRGKHCGTNLDAAFRLFDAGIEFQPLTRQVDLGFAPHQTTRLQRYLTLGGWRDRLTRLTGTRHRLRDSVYDYSKLVQIDLAYDFQKGYPIFPGVSPGFDNSSRRQNDKAVIFHGSTPDLFAYWTREKLKLTKWELLPEGFLFVNAWNEWAEGNHLEPCQRWGLGYLEALRSSIGHAHA